MEDFKYKKWVFTWNFENDGPQLSEDHLIHIMDTVAISYAFQLEKVSREHYQGFFILQKRKRKKTVLNEIQNILEQFKFLEYNFIKNLTIDRMFGTVEEALTYCSKSESQIGQTIYSKDLQPYIPNDLAVFSNDSLIYEWQRDIREMLFGNRDFLNKRELIPADDRSIILIVDNYGNSGKSKLVKYLCYNYEDEIIKVAFGTAQQLRSAVISAGRKKVYILDIPRTLGPSDDIHDIISVVEDIKNGFVCSSMYGKYEKLLMAPPHVIIFTNKELNPNMMSKDRWLTYRLTMMKSLFKYKLPDIPKI